MYKYTDLLLMYKIYVYGLQINNGMIRLITSSSCRQPCEKTESD